MPLSVALACTIALALEFALPGNLKGVRANLVNNSQITSTWTWHGSSTVPSGASIVQQRYGCTLISGEDPAPAGWCPNGYNWHHGIDVGDNQDQPYPAVGCSGAYVGNNVGPGAPVYADGPATVVQAGARSYGTIVEWQRDSDGYYVVLYHTQAIQVYAGERLYAGQPVAQVGDAGYPTYASACHLHFEVRKPPGGYWDDVDPSAYLGTSPYQGRAAVDGWSQGNFNGTINILALGADSSIDSNSQTSPSSATWQGWTSLGGGLGSWPTAGLDSNSVLVFARGPASPDALWYGWQSASGWSGWFSLGGLIQGTPASGTLRDGDPAVFARGQGTDPLMFWQYQRPTDGTWSGWLSLGGGLISDPVVASNQDGSLEVFAEGPTGAFWYDKESGPDSTSWSGWAPVSGGFFAQPTKPGVARNTDGTLQLFGLGPANGTIWTTRQPSPGNNSWPSWSAVPNGSLASDPVAASTADGSLDVFALGPNSDVWSDKQTAPGSSNWTGWVDIGDFALAVPSVRLNTDGTLSVTISVPYLRSCNGIDTVRESSPNGISWSGWQALRCP